MNTRVVKKLLLPLASGIVIIILWQILVLNLLENARIGSFTALVLLCLFYAILGGCAAAAIRTLFKRIELIAKPDALNSIDVREREKLDRLEKRDDELGKLISSATQSIQSFSEVINGIKKATDELEVVTGRFKELFGDMSDAIAETDQSTSTIAANIRNQEKEILSMQQKVDEINRLIVAISQQMQDLDLSASQMLEYDKTVVHNVEELTALSAHGSEMIQDVKQQSIQTNETMRQVSTITEIISGIAKQTKLLAVNASIEAARAGEHGKGFAVVAAEIKNLAEQSKDAVEKIDHMIKQMKTSSSENLKSAEFVFEAFEKQALKIEETEQTLLLLNEEFAKMGAVSTKVNEIVSKLIENKERINSASISLIDSGAENAQSVEKAVLSMEMLKRISRECDMEKDRIVKVSDGLISYISRFRSYIKKRIEERSDEDSQRYS